MSVQTVSQQTDIGWEVHVTGADDVVVRTEGARLVVAVMPDEPEPPTQPLPLSLTDAAPDPNQ